MPKTIIVSNRLPVKISKTDNEYQLSPSEGGLATGLGSVYKQGDNVWIGWPGQEVTEQADREIITDKLKDLSLLPVFHYYASTYATYTQSNWDYYKIVNEKFKEAILKVAEPGDTIWIHDYQ